MAALLFRAPILASTMRKSISRSSSVGARPVLRETPWSTYGRTTGNPDAHGGGRSFACVVGGRWSIEVVVSLVWTEIRRANEAPDVQ